MEKHPSSPLTYQIIGAAIEVHRTLGPGLLENVYENALCVELTERNLQYHQQAPIQVDYKGHNIGNLIVDIMVENRVIVELKSVKQITPLHTAQLMGYLKLTDLRTGLLINFNVEVLRDGVRRYVL